MPDRETASRRAASEQQAVDHVETGIVKRDGTVVWTDVSAVPISLPGWQVIVVTFDLSTRRPGRAVPGASEPN